MAERWEWRWKSGTLHVLSEHPEHRYGRAVLSIDHDTDGRPYIRVSDEHAALIAAAPDMLMALEAARRVFASRPAMVAQYADAYAAHRSVEMALREARGEEVG